ncbi:MAG: diaminopimelate decarboxylase [Elusimicrobia bacterium]|nr:diaminopimelate decarboxylase [Elusimicrobiota bacterium]
MGAFDYQKGELYCERLKVKEIIAAVGTPCYLYSHRALVENYQAFNEAFTCTKHLVCYAVKTNANLTILRTLANLGAGADIVSAGELYLALTAGFKPEKIVFAGVGKTGDEIYDALKNDILMFNVESLPELDLISSVAKKVKKRARISFRVNPDINPQTHHHISTGLAQNKFGININFAAEAYERASLDKFLEVVGVQVHIGSQITTVEPFVEAVEKVFRLLKTLKELALELKYIDLGGGLGITYNDEKPPTPQDLAQALSPLIRKSPYHFIFEPGRYIAGTAGILVTKILYLKETQVKKFVIVDAGMNDLSRPVMYDAYHEIKPVRESGQNEMLVDIVGPICESGDYFAKNRRLPLVEQGDLLAIFNAGAYGFSMSSNYNARPRACEVVVSKNQYYIVRDRETFGDLVSNERLLDIK